MLNESLFRGEKIKLNDLQIISNLRMSKGCCYKDMFKFLTCYNVILCESLCLSLFSFCFDHA